MLTKTFLKRITHAHSWLGLIISGLLFVVFLCGSISIYRDEISQWAIQPHYQLAQGEHKSVSDIMSLAIAGQNFDATEHLTIILPTEATPYFTAYVDVLHEKDDKDYIGFIMDPVTGEKLTDSEQFFLADFIYKLHYELNIPAGLYIIGFVTLIFFFALVSGILIHAKKIFSNFFKYRTDQAKRSHLLDLHNVIGIMSLPFTLMYAISGLIFNLVIIYQIAFAVVLYQGDQDALLHDAGYSSVEPVWADKTWKSPNIDSIINNIDQRDNHVPLLVRMYNYGDESSVVHVIGAIDNELGGRFDIATAITTGKETALNDPINPNMVRKGLQVIANLHFGNYAGYDLRLLYFILGISVCVLIVAGNLLWIEKRKKHRHYSTLSITIASKYTLISTAGVFFSIAFIFILERILPLELAERDQWLIIGFCCAMLLSGFITTLSSNIKYCLVYLLKASAFMGISLVIYDVIFYVDKIVSLTFNGQTNTAWTDVSIAIVSALTFYIAQQLSRDKNVSLKEANLLLS